MTNDNDHISAVSLLHPRPDVIPRGQHNISRAHISANALRVLNRLKNAGYKACLVGGSVRDLLLERRPKDFDVATDALPEQVRELFRNCRLIGRRFRLAHIRFGSEIIEVSTFRAAHGKGDGGWHNEGGRIVRDNVYGDIDDDVWRRDFTINSLFYNIQDFSVVDYTGGMEDIRRRLVRLIGNPEQRFREDPVRMLRAVRFAAKLDFKIEPRAKELIERMASLLDDVPPARLFEEFQKLFLTGHGRETFERMRHYALFARLFPLTWERMRDDDVTSALLQAALTDTDRRIAEDEPVSPAFLLAAFLWHSMLEVAEKHQDNGLLEYQAFDLAAGTVFSRQVRSLRIPRRLTPVVRDIWNMQLRFKNTRRKLQAEKAYTHPAWRAGYDFLMLRADAGEAVQDQVEYWQPLSKRKRRRLGAHTPQARPARKRRRRRSR